MSKAISWIDVFNKTVYDYCAEHDIDCPNYLSSSHSMYGEIYNVLRDYLARNHAARQFSQRHSPPNMVMLCSDDVESFKDHVWERVDVVDHFIALGYNPNDVRLVNKALSARRAGRLRDDDVILDDDFFDDSGVTTLMDIMDQQELGRFYMMKDDLHYQLYGHIKRLGHKCDVITSDEKMCAQFIDGLLAAARGILSERKMNTSRKVRMDVHAQGT